MNRYLLSLLIFISTLSLQSCGTLRGRKEVIVVDSNPRGLLVEIDEEQHRTPFVFKMKRAYEKQIKLLPDQDHKKTESITYPCRIDWLEAVLPNFIPSIYSTVISGFNLSQTLIYAGVLNGGDGITGALFTCDKIQITPKFKTEIAQDPCYDYAVIPFPSNSLGDSRQITEFWIDKIGKRVSSCSHFISNDVLEEALFKFGWIAGRPFDISELSRPAQLYIAEKFNVDFIVSLGLNNQGQITHQSLDVASEKIYENHFEGIPVYPPNGTQITLPKEKTFWDKLNITLFPNAISISGVVKQYGEIEDKWGDYNKVKEQEVSRLPKYVSAIGITDITHPGAYNNYDFRLSLHPELRSYYHHSKARYEYQDQIESLENVSDFEYEAKFAMGALNVSTGLTLFTPMGSISGNLLFGIYGASFDDSFEDSTLEFGPLWGAIVRWSGFVSDNMFVYYEAEQVRFFKKTPIEREMYRLNHLRLVRFGVGYMFDFEKNSGRVTGLFQ